MVTKKITLCFPDQEKSCFGCCPPIRPAGYEHIQYVNIIKRILRENVRLYNNKERSIVPITGYSCWALGYLDKDCKQVGCMLHPFQNSGEDLRFRIDYGMKCQREACYEKRTFSLLDSNHQKFWLHLAKGLDSFAYSSKVINPLFKMLGWGVYLLELIATKEQGKSFTRESFFRTYKFFSMDLSPRSSAYIMNRLITPENTDILKDTVFASDLINLLNRISKLLKIAPKDTRKSSYVHLLDIDPLFSDFLRLHLQISKMEMVEAVKLKDIVDQEVERFKR